MSFVTPTEAADRESLGFPVSPSKVRAQLVSSSLTRCSSFWVDFPRNVAWMFQDTSYHSGHSLMDSNPVLNSHMDVNGFGHQQDHEAHAVVEQPVVGRLEDHHPVHQKSTTVSSDEVPPLSFECIARGNTAPGTKAPNI